jgi:hypothetical protein
MDDQEFRAIGTIRDYALEAREATVRDFDNKNKTQLETTLAELGKLYAVKLMGILKNVGLEEGTAGAQFEVYALGKSSLDVLVSALQMARQRAPLEVFSLLRIALEAGCTSLQISRDADAYRRYMTGSYKSTAAIRFAKTLIPVVGEIWGDLSNAAVHITQRGYGARLEVDENGDLVPGVTFECALRSQLPFQDGLLLSFISLVTIIVLKMIELTLSAEASGAWLKLAGGQVKYFHNSDALISKYLADIKAVPAIEAGGGV